MRGFETNTLGPRDSKNEPLGGNLATSATAELILPIPFLKTSTRCVSPALWMSGTSLGITRNRCWRPALLGGCWRYLAVAVRGHDVRYAVPLKTKSGDEVEPFQFTFGTSF